MYIKRTSEANIGAKKSLSIMWNVSKGVGTIIRLAKLSLLSFGAVGQTVQLKKITPFGWPPLLVYCSTMVEGRGRGRKG